MVVKRILWCSKMIEKDTKSGGGDTFNGDGTTKYIFCVCQCVSTLLRVSLLHFNEGELQLFYSF